MTDNSDRRQLSATVVGCAAATGVALFATSRTWVAEAVVRAPPLPPVVTPHSGGSLVPALPALALVALAGAGGLVATRGAGRRLVAACVLAAGLGLAVLALANVGRSGVAVGWVLGTAACGVAIAVLGGFALVRGGTWPSLGSRYERSVRSAVLDQRSVRPQNPDLGKVDESGPASVGSNVADKRSDASDQVDGPVEPSGEVANQALWDAIERGEDPTKS